jgi:CRISPR/Cas system-associated exonuclease Cas4 (RecB family)
LTLVEEWHQKSVDATSKGNKLHQTMEAALKRKTVAQRGIRKFANSNPHLILFKSELTVWDFDFWIAGKLDAILWNEEFEGLELHDHKTDEKIELTNKFQNLLPPVSHLPDTNNSKYALQLNLYRHCFEKHTGLEIKRMFINHIMSEDVFQYEIPRMEEETQAILNFAKHLQI